MRHSVKVEWLQGNPAARRAMEIALAGDHDVMLVGPLGSGKTTIREAFKEVITYEMELCGCGASPVLQRECTCSPALRVRYMRRFIRLSAGMDLVVETHQMTVREMMSAEQSDSKEDVKLRVFYAVRFGEDHKDTSLDPASSRTMEMAARKCEFTCGQYQSCIRVARTIANLDGSERIEAKHVAEAVQYRADVHLLRRFQLQVQAA